MPAVEILPNPAFEPHAEALRSYVTSVADGLRPDEFHLVLDPSLKASFHDALDHIGASEGTIWIADRQQSALVPVFNTGPKADQFVLKHKQPLNRGIVSSVLLTEIGVAERDVYKHSAHDPEANKLLEVLTCSMVAVPFFFAGRIRGVLSAVKLKPASAPESEDPPPFEGDALRRLNNAAAVLGTAVECRLIKSSFALR